MLSLTDEAWGQLRDVNHSVNVAVGYRTDMDLYGKLEHWTPAVAEGDCEDYALTKRQRLLALGWPLKALRLAVCRVEGQGHAVLTVDTDRGVYVLDNRYPRVMPWKDLPYVWISRQATEGGWVSLRPTAGA